MITKIENEIEILTPKEQVKLFNWFGKLIKKSQRAGVYDKAEMTATSMAKRGIVPSICLSTLWEKLCPLYFRQYMG